MTEASPPMPPGAERALRWVAERTHLPEHTSSPTVLRADQARAGRADQRRDPGVERGRHRRPHLRRHPSSADGEGAARMLIDLAEMVGLERMAQADLGRRVHRNRPLTERGSTGYAIARTILRRAEERGRLNSLVNFPCPPLLVRNAEGELDAETITEAERSPIEFAPAYLEALRITRPAGTGDVRRDGTVRPAYLPARPGAG